MSNVCKARRGVVSQLCMAARKRFGEHPSGSQGGEVVGVAVPDIMCMRKGKDPRYSSRRKFISVVLKTVAGIVIPAVLLQFDPFLFGGQDGDSLGGSLSACVYVLMFLSMTARILRYLYIASN